MIGSQEKNYQVSLDLKLNSYFIQLLCSDHLSKIIGELEDIAFNIEIGKPYEFDFNLFSESSKHSSKNQPKIPQLLSQPFLAPQLSTHFQRNLFDPFKEHSHKKIPLFYSKNKSRRSRLKDFKFENLQHILLDKLGLPTCFASVIESLFNHDSTKFITFFNENLLSFDSNECFFKLVTLNQKKFVIRSDLYPFIDSIVNSHESLRFLSSEDEIKTQFIEFIATSLFYRMDLELRSSINVSHFRRYDLAGQFLKAEQIADINQSNHSFNYRHFYVAFCKFWNLDSDQDSLLHIDDLLKFNDGKISPLIIKRVFNGCESINFNQFVYFLISVHNKTSPTAVSFWFKLCDLDDDGILSPHEISTLYESQYELLKITGNEAVPYQDVFRQLIDMARPKNPVAITLQDLMDSKLTEYFFNILFDLEKFIVDESSLPWLEQPQVFQLEVPTKWDIYVSLEYDKLVSEE